MWLQCNVNLAITWLLFVALPHKAHQKVVLDNLNLMATAVPRGRTKQPAIPHKLLRNGMMKQWSLRSWPGLPIRLDRNQRIQRQQPDNRHHRYCTHPRGHVLTGKCQVWSTMGPPWIVIVLMHAPWTPNHIWIWRILRPDRQFCHTPQVHNALLEGQMPLGVVSGLQVRLSSDKIQEYCIVAKCCSFHLSVVLMLISVRVLNMLWKKEIHPATS